MKCMHIKTGKIYELLERTVINTTNGFEDDEQMCLYTNGEKTFVRRQSEFYRKFIVPLVAGESLKEGDFAYSDKDGYIRKVKFEATEENRKKEKVLCGNRGKGKREAKDIKTQVLGCIQYFSGNGQSVSFKEIHEWLSHLKRQSLTSALSKLVEDGKIGRAGSRRHYIYHKLKW